MSGPAAGVAMCAVGLVLVAGCGGDDAGARDASAPVTVTATATATATATVTGEASPAAAAPPRTDVFAILVDNEYPPPTLRDIARSICREVRTGQRDRSFPWRDMIGYVGDRRVGAYIGYSVATYCPEDADDLLALMQGRLPR